MHITSIALLWVMIQTLPLVVMLVIYYFFAEQNFFQIEGLWKGVIASGPIAAYVFLTWLQILQGTRRDSRPQRQF